MPRDRACSWELPTCGCDRARRAKKDRRSTDFICTSTAVALMRAGGGGEDEPQSAPDALGRSASRGRHPAVPKRTLSDIPSVVSSILLRKRSPASRRW